MADLLSVPQASERLNVSPRRVRQLIDEGELEASRVGRAWMINRGSVERRQRQPSASGRPLERRRVWYLALVADRLVDDFLSQIGGRSPSELLEHERKSFARRLEGPLKALGHSDPWEIADSSVRRDEFERALREALEAVRHFEHRQEAVHSGMERAFPLDAARSEEGCGQIELCTPGDLNERAAIRRLRNSLAHGAIEPDDLAAFRGRANSLRGYYAHPSILSRMRADERLVVSGPHAANFYGLELVGGDHVEAYVAEGDVDDVGRDHALEACDIDVANVWLRQAGELPFRARFAPRLLVAADLLERVDERSRTAAFQLLDLIVAAIQWREDR